MSTWTFKELRRRMDDRMDSLRGNRHAYAPHDYARALNQALVLIGQHCFVFDPTVRLTLTSGEQTVDLQDPAKVTRRVIRPLKLYIAGECRGAIVAPIDLERNAPNWRMAREGRPAYAAWSGGPRLTFDRPVDAATASAGVSVSAYVIPAVLGADGSARPLGFTTDVEAPADQWSENLGALTTVTRTATSGSCAMTSANAGDLGAADGTAITAQYRTPDCTDAIE